MKAIEFPEVNVRYAENQPEYETLPVFKHPDDAQGCVISCWQLEPEELKKVNRTGKLWMHILTFNQALQPISLDVQNPFASLDEIISEVKQGKQHFIQVQSYQTKNRAHAEAQEYVEKYDDCLIDDIKLQEFKDKLEWAIVQINKKYPRCQDIRSSATSFTDGHQSISIEGNFHMSITEVKRHELSNQEGVTR